MDNFADFLSLTDSQEIILKRWLGYDDLSVPLSIEQLSHSKKEWLFFIYDNYKDRRFFPFISIRTAGAMLQLDKNRIIMRCSSSRSGKISISYWNQSLNLPTHFRLDIEDGTRKLSLMDNSRFIRGQTVQEQLNFFETYLKKL